MVQTVVSDFSYRFLPCGCGIVDWNIASVESGIFSSARFWSKGVVFSKLFSINLNNPLLSKVTVVASVHDFRALYSKFAGYCRLQISREFRRSRQFEIGHDEP